MIIDIMEVRRAAFSKAMTLEGYSQLELVGDHYRCSDIDGMWRGFKMALDSAVVELPEADVVELLVESRSYIEENSFGGLDTFQLLGRINAKIQEYSK